MIIQLDCAYSSDFSRYAHQQSLFTYKLQHAPERLTECWDPAATLTIFLRDKVVTVFTRDTKRKKKDNVNTKFRVLVCDSDYHYVTDHYLGYIYV